MTRQAVWWVAALSVGLSGCTPVVDPWKDEPGAPRVVVTIPPLYSFVKGVGGDRVAVKCLCTDRGPHHFKPDVSESLVLRQADLFFAVGLQLDDKFADTMESQSRNPKLRYVKLGKRLPHDLLRHAHKHDDKGEKKGHEGHDHGEHDPHVWLGIRQAVAMVNMIRDELAGIDPDHADDYHKNAAKYVKGLRALEAEGKEMLKEKKSKRIVSFHESLGYFAATFGLDVADVIEVVPGEPPSPRHLAELVELCRDKKKPVVAIAVEPQYPKSTSAQTLKDTLAGKGLKVPLVEVDPLETADDSLKKRGARWYEDRVRYNLKALTDKLP